MTATEQHVADIRALVRWWVVAFAAMASTAIAGLAVFEVGSLRPWARVAWLLILVCCFAIAIAVLLAVARVFQLPREWAGLSREEQERSADFGAGPEQLAVWDRSTTDRHRADEVRQQVVAAVRLRDCGVALERMRVRLRLAATTVLLLLVALVVVRDGPVCANAPTPRDHEFTLPHMLPKLDTPQVFDLNLADYNANGASIGSGQNGTTFTFTIWPLSDATVAALDDLVQKHGTIRLHCCRVPVLFDLVTIERKEPRKARIEGRIVGGVSYAKDAG